MTLDKCIKSKRFGRRTAGVAMLFSMAVLRPSAAFAETITLGSAQSFAVLGGAGVAVNGSCCTVISGNVGDDPAASSLISGFPAPGKLVNGSLYGSDLQGVDAGQARFDENTAYNALAALQYTADDTGHTLGTGGGPFFSTLLPGVYKFTSSAQVDGALTLDFNGESNALFVFQIASTLTTKPGASIHVKDGNSTDAIYWQVGDSATLGDSTAFAGNILALNAIALDPFASIACGRAFAYTASVTMADRNFISGDCSVYNTASGLSANGPTDFGSIGFSSPAAGGSGASVPEPGTFLLLGLGLAGVVVKFSARRI